MTWDAIIKRVKQGETTAEDAHMLDLLRKALQQLDDHYPGDGGYFNALARVLQMHRQMTNSGETSC